MEASALIRILHEFGEGAIVRIVRQSLYVTDGSEIKAVINLETGQVNKVEKGQ